MARGPAHARRGCAESVRPTSVRMSPSLLTTGIAVTADTLGREETLARAGNAADRDHAHGDLQELNYFWCESDSSGTRTQFEIAHRVRER